MRKRILGVDVGGVITDRINNDGTDTDFKRGDYLKTTAVPDAFESLKILNSRFNGLVYVVSKCRLKTELKTRRWMRHHGFYDITGISPENVYYCRERWEKAPICKWLGVTDFIDDKLEVLSYLNSVPNKYLFGPQKKEEIEKFKQHLSLVTPVESWNKFLELIL